MPRIDERRRHAREVLTCPAVLRDRSGRVLFRGRAADISPCGIRIIGRGGLPLREGQQVWVDLSLPSIRLAGPRIRHLKMSGEIRRINVMGEWRSIIVVIFETEFTRNLLDPML
jgi:hypothetical protein